MNRDGIGPPPQARPLATLFGILVALLAVAAVIGIWWLATLLGVSRTVLPPPLDALKAYGEMLNAAPLWNATRVTALNAAIGFGIGTLVGGLFGLLFGANHGFRRLMDGAGSVILALPVFCAAPILVVGYGTTPGGIVTIAAAALASAPTVAFLIGAALGTERQGSRLFLALQVGALAALAGVVVGELVASQQGLGHMLMSVVAALRMDQAFAMLGHLWLLGLVFSLPFALIRWMVK